MGSSAWDELLKMIKGIGGEIFGLMKLMSETSTVAGPLAAFDTQSGFAIFGYHCKFMIKAYCFGFAKIGVIGDKKFGSMH